MGFYKFTKKKLDIDFSSLLCIFFTFVRTKFCTQFYFSSMESIEFLGYCAALLIGLTLGLIGGGGSILAVPALAY
jgi:hypothetical protein